MSFFLSLLNAMPGAITQGMLWGIMAIGVYITYRILDVADLTVDGSLATGGAVCVTLRQEKQAAVLRVADTGPGIPADCRESIFQPFFRVDKSRSREMGGVGLGLALVREIAVLHGGSVTVESSSENGTTFSVTLPLAQPC